MDSIALFPLNTLLFPGVPMELRIFEQRYLTMISRCLKQGQGFGVVKIISGDEVIKADQWQPPEVFPLGVYVQVTDWNQLANGLLGISIQGERKFKVLKTHIDADRLLQAEVMFLPDEVVEPVGEAYNGLADLLGSLRDHPAVAGLKLPEVTNTRQLGWQLTQLLPLSTRDKLALLELSDPEARLDHLSVRVARLAK